MGRSRFESRWMRLVMDPLGKAAEIVEVDSLKRWSHSPAVHHLTGEEKNQSDSSFPYNPQLNDKIVLWRLVGREAQKKSVWIFHTFLRCFGPPLSSNGQFLDTDPGVLASIPGASRFFCEAGGLKWIQLSLLAKALVVLSQATEDGEIEVRISVGIGDISLLNVDAIVNTTNESLTEWNPTSERIFQRAGSTLRVEVEEEVQGHNLPARFIIHTVGPKYNIKYQSAAENTLHFCYRNVLQKARELEVSSIALSVINSVRRNFPPDEGAHIALRTVRRFLDQFGSSLDTVVFVVDNTDIGIYEVLLPLYFPRSTEEEEVASWQLPANVGGANGEPVQPDRQIRIIDNPQHSLDDESVNLSTQLSVGEHAFTQMQGDLDQQRLLGERPLTDPLDDLLVREMHTKER
uniref:Macro domain-containing protein n=1 Tax=Timema genevievae TaxID=629358 RepID=A0A7R9K087_TIMGE|nr:unnamed protein product [Timema genevievae]